MTKQEHKDDVGNAAADTTGPIAAGRRESRSRVTVCATTRSSLCCGVFGQVFVWARLSCLLLSFISYADSALLSAQYKKTSKKLNFSIHSAIIMMDSFEFKTL